MQGKRTDHRPWWRKMKTRNKILLGTFGFELVFIAIMCLFFAKFQTIPDTLCTCVLGAGGVTELITGGISIAEVLKKE